MLKFSKTWTSWRIGQGKPHEVQHRYGADLLESSSAKDGQVHCELALCLFVAKEDNHILGCLKKSMAGKLREALVCSALLRPHLVCCVHFCATQFKKGGSCPIPGTIPGQTVWGSEQLGLVDLPAHCKWGWTRLSLSSLPTQTSL